MIKIEPIRKQTLEHLLILYMNKKILTTNTNSIDNGNIGTCEIICFYTITMML